MSPDLEQLQTLYISQPEQHQIIRINKVSNVENGELESNFERFIGNGDRCLPGDSDGCGDGGKAINARLAYPKGKFNLITHVVEDKVSKTSKLEWHYTRYSILFIPQFSN